MAFSGVAALKKLGFTRIFSSVDTIFSNPPNSVSPALSLLYTFSSSYESHGITTTFDLLVLISFSFIVRKYN